MRNQGTSFQSFNFYTWNIWICYGMVSCREVIDVGAGEVITHDDQTLPLKGTPAYPQLNVHPQGPPHKKSRTIEKPSPVSCLV